MELGHATPRAESVRGLFLDVSVNGVRTGLVAAFEQNNGTMLAEPDELLSVGIKPADVARQPDGRIAIERIPGLRYSYDEARQTIDFTAGDAQRVAAAIDLDGARSVLDAQDNPPPSPQSGFGGLLNYSLFVASPSGDMGDLVRFDGASGAFEARMFSPYGVVAQTFVSSTDAAGLSTTTRLDSNCAYSDPATLQTFRAGDLITGGLDWTRPTRLAGVQIQRDFALRSDLVTLPMPEISGSAAVPSTVDVYLNGTRRLSKEVDAGPFELTHVPVVTGAGTARVVVRDAAGRERVSESAFFSSPKLLAKGLTDYSAELGFGRQSFGSESNLYDPRPMGSASLRYGVTGGLTLEGHAEGGAEIANVGMGAVMAVGSLGTVSASAATSRSAAFGTGLQVGAAADLELGPVTLAGRVQRTYDDYQDIASIIDADAGRGGIDGFPARRRPASAINQLAVSLPLGFDPSSVNLSFTEVERQDAAAESIVGLSYRRTVGKTGAVYLAGFSNLQSGAFGVSAGLSLSLDETYSASTAVNDTGDGPVASAVLSRRGGNETGDYAWTLRDSESGVPHRSASGRYHAGFADIAGIISQSDDRFRATAQADGAVVLAGGDVFLARPINNAFAVVDVGIAGVGVERENRPAGRTNARGKLLVPDLRAFEKNRISIVPTDLPLDTTLNATRQTIVPADRAGVVVAFDAVGKGGAALVSFRDGAGHALPLGTTGRLGGDGDSVTVGYDGQAFVDGLEAINDVVFDLPDGGRCVARFAYQREGDTQVAIPDAVCRAVDP